MKGKKIIDFWDRSNRLNLRNKGYGDFVSHFFSGKLGEDKASNDITSNSIIPKNKKAAGKIVAKQGGIVSGVDEASYLFKGFNIKKFKKNGDKIKKFEIILEIRGGMRKMLALERTALNVMQRMSGIATKTHEIRMKSKGCGIAATRKTLWHLLDKKAVSDGGGLTHRLDLADSILIKDNHLESVTGDAEKALFLASKNKKTKFIEIEVKNIREAVIAADAISPLIKNKAKKCYAIMFDNMNPKQIKKAIYEIRKISKEILFEASGGINEGNIGAYSKAGVDIVSLGALTHSAKALDMSMEIIH